MISKITSKLFSFNGASILIGVIGILSSIVTLFINVNEQISIKWFLFLLVVSISFGLALVKIIFELMQEKNIAPSYETPIRYVESEHVFVIRRNENFINNIMVGCYSIQDEIHRLAYLGVVHLVQDNLIQIKIHQDFQVLTSIPSTQEQLKSLLIRPVVPFTALQTMNKLEESDS